MTKAQVKNRSVAFKNHVRNILPWVFCALIFVYLFRQIPPHDIAEVLRLADVPRLFFYGFIYFLIVWIVDLFALKHFLSRFATPVTLREMSLVRGVTYLMMIVNYAASQGILAVYLKKTHRASVGKTLGTLFLISFTDMLLVFTSALLALSFSATMYHGFNLQRLAFQTVPVLYGGFFLWVLFWKNVHRDFVGRFRRFRVVNWLLEHDLFLIFRDASLKDYLILLLFRAPLLVIIIGGYNFALYAFQSSLDWGWIYLYNPIVMFITALPITPAGLGTGQILVKEFYANLLQSPLLDQGMTNADTILVASSLAWNLINQLYKAVMGLICLSLSSKNLYQDTVDIEKSP